MKNNQVSEPASIRITKIWCDRWTRPNSRLLAQPSAVVSSADAKRTTKPMIEMKIVMARRYRPRARSAMCPPLPAHCRPATR